MNARLEAIQKIGKRKPLKEAQTKQLVPSVSWVFHRGLIESLPKKLSQHWLALIDGKERLNPHHADLFADALKKWAIQEGATHFVHWFYPLAQKDFLLSQETEERAPEGMPLGQLHGKEWLRREFSFPSEWLTQEGSGYALWDPTASPFLRERTEGLTLCLPSLFFSRKGAAFDHKIPLLRSEEKLHQVTSRLLKLAGIEAQRVYSILGIEQQYYLIDRNLYLLRPDLRLIGRTVFGAKPHCEEIPALASERAISFMRELEEVAFRLSIPIKVRETELAPAQYEVLSVAERAPFAVDHNLQLREIMQEIARRQDLVCLFHEKPFQQFNSSRKLLHWSLRTETGRNLFDPKGNRFLFSVLLTALLRGLHDQGTLLLAVSVDHDPSTGETFPLSVALDGSLEPFVREILPEKKVSIETSQAAPFAFTEGHFTLRHIGASVHCGLPISLCNAILADSLQLILDELADHIKDQKLEGEELFAAARPVLRKHLNLASSLFASPNSRPVDRCSFSSGSDSLSKKSERLFSEILNEEELRSLYEVQIAHYAQMREKEAHLMIELFQTQILPAIKKEERKPSIETLFAEATETLEALQKGLAQVKELGWEAKAKVFCELLHFKTEDFRNKVDQLESVIDNALWPLPKYRELLFCL